MVYRCVLVAIDTQVQTTVAQGLSNFMAQQIELDDVQRDQLTDQLVLDALVQAQGVCKLAAEKLCVSLGWPIQLARQIERAIPSIVSVRLPELKQQMETLATLELFGLMPQLHKTLTENLTKLEPGEAVQAYMKLMDLIAKKTDANELTINLNDRRFSGLPRSVQQLYAQLEASGQLQQVIDHDASDIDSTWHPMAEMQQ